MQDWKIINWREGYLSDRHEEVVMWYGGKLEHVMYDFFYDHNQPKPHFYKLNEVIYCAEDPAGFLKPATQLYRVEFAKYEGYDSYYLKVDFFVDGLGSKYQFSPDYKRQFIVTLEQSFPFKVKGWDRGIPL